MQVVPLTCWLVLGLQDPVSGPELVAGEVRAGAIEADAQRIETRVLTTSYQQTPAAAAFDLRVETSGPYHVDLRSAAFDAYLVVRSGDVVLAEDDDGLIGLDARVVLELEPDVTYRVEACALHDRRGPFEIVLERGVPEPWTPAERAALELEHVRERVTWAEGEAGGDGALAGHAWNLLGETLRRQGRYAEARDAHQRGFDLRQAALGDEHLDTLESMHNLVVISIELEDLPRARELGEQLLAVRERLFGPEDRAVALSLLKLSDVLRLQGEYELARQHCSRALSIFESFFGPNHSSTIATMNALGQVHKELLDYDAAEDMFQRAIQAAEATFGPDHVLTVAALNNLGQLELEIGHLGEARLLLERALAAMERTVGAEHPKTLVVQGNLASLMIYMGDVDGAGSLHERTLAARERVLPADHPDIAGSQSGVSASLYWRGDYRGAVEFQARAVASLRRVLGDQHPRTLRAIVSLGQAYASSGDQAEAERLLREALAGQERFPGYSPAKQEGLFNLALVVRRRDPAAAVELFERALAIAVQHREKGHRVTANILWNLVDTLTQLRQAERAWEVLEEHSGERQVRIGQNLASMTESERHTYMAVERLELEKLLGLAVSLHKPSEGYAAVLEWKGRVLRMLLASREQLLADLSAEQRELVERLRRAQASLSALVLVESGADPASRDARLDELAGERNRLELELVRSIEGGGDPGVTWPELRASLPAGAALVDFIAFDRLLAFVLRPDRDVPTLLDLGSVEPIETAVRAHRGALLGEAELGPSNEALRQLLWAPLAAELGGAELVFVSPDGFLGGLPFEVIRQPDGRYLVEEHAFVYLEDASALPQTLALGKDAGFDSLLACGGLSYDRSSAPEGAPVVAAADFTSSLRGSFATSWNSLPGTLGEVDLVVELFARARGPLGQVTRLSGPEASEPRLKRELPRHRVLHLATHGFFEPEGVPSLWAQALDNVQADEPVLREGPRRLVGLHPGLLSGLVCSGANDPGAEGQDDGYLTAEELQWLDLSGVRLLVLSACETALGEPRSGDGMIGLRRACHVAGARTVISSLWSVMDDSPASLMAGFYENLWLGGMGPLEALRSAQLRLIAERQPPAAWGAFVLSGDWR